MCLMFFVIWSEPLDILVSKYIPIHALSRNKHKHNWPKLQSEFCEHLLSRTSLCDRMRTLKPFTSSVTRAVTVSLKEMMFLCVGSSVDGRGFHSACWPSWHGEIRSGDKTLCGVCFQLCVWAVVGRWSVNVNREERGEGGWWGGFVEVTMAGCKATPPSALV